LCDLHQISKDFQVALQKIFSNDLTCFQYKTIDSPIGSLTLVANHKALLQLNWGSVVPNIYQHQIGQVNTEAGEILTQTERQLKEYFQGIRAKFELPLFPYGTEFQMQAWRELLRIPYGQLDTYGEQAKRMGAPNSARAVGAANGKNPIGIIIPCHRVIGASGHLTGFAGGLGIKKFLIDLETRRVNNFAKTKLELTTNPLVSLS